MADEHDLPLEAYHQAGLAITNGDSSAYKPLYSRRDDVTLANPFGPPALGWDEVSATLDRAAQNYRDGEIAGFENVSTVITDELRTRSRSSATGRGSGGPRSSRDVSIRVTTVYRREDGEWKVVHRHADPITTRREAESVVGG